MVNQVHLFSTFTTHHYEQVGFCIAPSPKQSGSLQALSPVNRFLLLKRQLLHSFIFSTFSVSGGATASYSRRFNPALSPTLLQDAQRESSGDVGNVQSLTALIALLILKKEKEKHPILPKPFFFSLLLLTQE